MVCNKPVELVGSGSEDAPNRQDNPISWKNLPDGLTCGACADAAAPYFSFTDRAAGDKPPSASSCTVQDFSSLKMAI